MAVFAVPRLIHAALLNKFWGKWLYSETERESMRESGKVPDPAIDHLLPAIIYIIAFPGLAFIIYMIWGKVAAA